MFHASADFFLSLKWNLLFKLTMRKTIHSTPVKVVYASCNTCNGVFLSLCHNNLLTFRKKKWINNAIWTNNLHSYNNKRIILQKCQRKHARDIDILNGRPSPKCGIIMLPLQEKGILFCTIQVSVLVTDKINNYFSIELS